jgi:signal transduction histidine kinase
VDSGPAPRAPLGAGGAWAVLAAAGLSVVAALSAVALITATRSWGLPSASQTPIDVTIALAYPTMGALVVLRGRGSRAAGLVMLGAGAAAATTALAAALASAAEQPTLAARIAAQVAGTTWVPGFLTLLTLLPLTFPDGLLPGRPWRVLAWLSAAGIALATLAVGLFPEPVQGRVRLEEVVVSEPLARALLPVAVVLLLAGGLGGLVNLVLRLVRSGGLVRRQVVVLLAAAAVLLLDVLAQPLLPAPADVLTQVFAVALVPVAVGVAVTRHRLYDLDLAVRHALAGLSLAACLAGLYVAAFVLLDAAVGGRTALASGLAAGLTGVLVLPLGTRLTRGVDRLFYGDRADRYAVLSTFSATLRERLDIAEVPQAVCDAVVASLRLSSAELVVDDRRRAAAGVPAGAPTELPLRHRGQVVGTVTVTPRAGEAALDERDAELVAALADSAAPAVAALRLTDSLQAAREQLVAAREEERRRVRRDLHDGVGAALSGLRLQLDSARDLVADPLAGKLLDAASEGLAEAVRDVRQVTDDLRPPALDDLGLAASIEGLARRVRTPALEVVVDVGDLPALPAAVDVACYRIAAEALANAATHARASRVAVGLGAAGGELLLTVADDGRGLPAVPRPAGLGLSSMRRRAEEIGGRCSIESGSGGTRVSVALPLGET